LNLVSVIVAAAVAASASSFALAQAPGPTSGPGSVQPQAAPAPAGEVRVVRPRDVTILSGSRFRVGNERYQVFGAALRRILSRGEIRIAPTGSLNALGDRLARVTVDGQSVARRLINARAAVIRRPGQNFNPWCLSLRRPPA
jgi:hypothetical protein